MRRSEAALVGVDNTANQATKTATDNTLIGAAVEAVGIAAGETTGHVCLNASF